MLLASLILHGAFLMFPIASEPAPVEEVEVSEEPEQAIALSALREPPKPAPKASPKPVPVPSPSITPIQRVEPPAPVPVPPAPSPSPAPIPVASPTPEPVASTTPEAGVTEAPAEDVPDDVAGMRANLMASLGSSEGLLGQAPPYRYFRQPELYFTTPDNQEPDFTKDPNVWVPGILGVDWYNDMRPEEAIAQFQTQFSSNGKSMEEVPTGYGRQPLFVIRENGTPLLYLNIIPAPGRVSTVVVQWDRDPNTPHP